mgnify:FL=1
MSARKHYMEDKIETVCFMDKYDCGDNKYLKLSALELRKEYLLYIRFNSSQAQSVELVLDKSISHIPDYTNEITDINNLSVNKGNNSLFIPVRVDESKPNYTIEIKGYSGIKKYVIENLKILDIYLSLIHI